MAFEKFIPPQTSGVRPRATIRPSGLISFDAATVETFGLDTASYAVLYFDLDRFKNINDSLGHMIGDELLQQVSMRLKECIRAGDTLARFGGDEFIVVLSGEPIDVAERLRRAVHPPVVVGEHELFVFFQRPSLCRRIFDAVFIEEILVVEEGQGSMIFGQGILGAVFEEECIVLGWIEVLDDGRVEVGRQVDCADKNEELRHHVKDEPGQHAPECRRLGNAAAPDRHDADRAP